MRGRYYACQGNTLAGREVVVAMAKGSLADRLMAALVAADCGPGGNRSGRLAARNSRGENRKGRRLARTLCRQ